MSEVDRLMHNLGINRATAEFMLALDRGDINGDIVAVDKEGNEVFEEYDLITDDTKQFEPLIVKGKPLKPVKKVVISDEDIDAAIAEWDRVVPEAAGLLRAIVEE